MDVSTRVLLFKINLRSNLRRLKKRIRQIFCAHKTWHKTINWTWSAEFCEGCFKQRNYESWAPKK